MTAGKWRLDSSVVDARHLSREASNAPTLSQGIAVSQSNSSSVFNRLPRYRVERDFGRRSAPLDPSWASPRHDLQVHRRVLLVTLGRPGARVER
jgi:hypothetical protein